MTLFLLILSISIAAQQRQFRTFPDLEKKIGQHFPIENYKNQKGENFKPDYLEGKFTLINFWSTTCEPCIKELPYLNSLGETLHENVNFIAITHDSNEKVEKFLAKQKFDFQHITNSLQELKSYFPLLRNPMTFIIDKNGNIKEITGTVDETKFDTLVKILSE